MTDLRKAARMALEYLNKVSDWDTTYPVGKAREALRQALTQPELKQRTGDCLITGICAAERHKIYTAPPKREWVGLTDEEVIKCFDSVAFGQVEDDLIINKHVNIFRAIHGIEAKLKEKNT